MYLQHFGLTHAPLGSRCTVLFDDGFLDKLRERFQSLLNNPSIGLLTGESGVGKTAALRYVTQNLNPHTYQLIYTPETDFSRLDIYRSLAVALGIEPAYRRAQLWSDLKVRIQDLYKSKNILPIWILDEAQQKRRHPHFILTLTHS